MAGKKDAEITIGADASAVERATAVAKAAFRDLGNAMKSSIGDAAQQVITDLGNVVLAQGKISFGSQQQQVREFEASTARLAASTRQNADTIRSAYEATGAAIGKRPQEVAAWTLEVGRLTYNYDAASKSIQGMDALARETGRNASDYRGLAVEMQLVGGVAGDTGHALGVLKSQADLLGTTGGVAALADQVEGLQDVMSRLGGTSEKGFATVTALAGELGKGLNPIAARRVQQTVLGDLSSDTVGWSRFLGRDITNEHGQIDQEKLPAILQEITSKIKHTYGKDARRMLQLQFGSEAGAALFNADFGEVQRVANAPASSRPAEAQRAYIQSDAGQRDVAQSQLAASSRDLLGSSTKLGQAADALQRFAASNPISSTLISTAIGGAMGNFLSTFGKSLATMMGGKGAGGAVGGVMDLATKGTAIGAAGIVPILGAGALGVGAGVAIGQAYNQWQDERNAPHEAAEAAERKASLTHAMEVRDRVRAARGLPTLPGALGGWQLPEEDTQLAKLAASGQKGGLEALISKLQKEGESPEVAKEIGEAVAAALARTLPQLQIQSAPDTPASMAISMNYSQYSGPQSGG